MAGSGVFFFFFKFILGCQQVLLADEGEGRGILYKPRVVTGWKERVRSGQEQKKFKKRA